VARVTFLLILFKPGARFGGCAAPRRWSSLARWDSGNVMIKVLIVEDDLDAASAQAQYVGRVPGFVVMGHVATGRAALQRLAVESVDLMLLDIYLPDMNGLEILRRVRAAGHPTDVMTMTRARDLAVIKAAVSYGATHYLVKPFSFATVRTKLEQYQAYRTQLDTGTMVVQADVDHLIGTLRDTVTAPLPKGVSKESLRAVTAVLESGSAGGVSAAEIAEVLGASRATARRYLEYLCETGLAERHARYGEAGRPMAEYRWRGPAMQDGTRPEAPGS
jgi:response regulator of citrate/malate metabolism